MIMNVNRGFGADKGCTIKDRTCPVAVSLFEIVLKVVVIVRHGEQTEFDLAF